MPDCTCGTCHHPRKDREIVVDKEARSTLVRVTCNVCNKWLGDEQSTPISTAA